ncbi:glycosyltransferase family 4 protein [Tepidicella baoligensis]|uniref:glycosyltransferase family 4 protein n=1 Tax=Tepidicella baoligensis TaxID=2707016 RepID=UPI0015DA22D9|nr:glycosyltransferase family 4 protein [Tepidicella baoligensis]
MNSSVLHVCLSKGWGGLEQYPLSLASELKEQGVPVCYCALADSRFAQKARSMNVPMMIFSSRTSVWLRWRTLQRWVREHHIQVVHFHKSSDLRLVPLFTWLFPGVRLVFTEHMNAKKPKHSFYHRWVYQRLYRVIAISDYTLANNLRALPVAAGQIERLYAGIDLKVFRPSLSSGEREILRASLGLRPDDVACCLPGRISPGKGHAVFVDAVVEWAHQHAGPGRVHAFVVGGLKADEGADEALVVALRAHIRQLGVEPLFTFTGYCAELQRLLQAMDMVCIPSAQEAFGLAVVEAMALGLPVVGSNSGAIPEILGENGECGLLAQPDDPRSFAAAFARLASSPDLRRSIGLRALEKVKTTFNLTQHVSRLKKIYQL